MKKIWAHPLLLLTIFCGIGYFGAELIIRGDALNKVSFGIAGYLLGGGILLLIFCWIVLPIINFSFYPEWINPQDINDARKRLDYLDYFAKFLLHQYRKKNPPEIDADLKKLRSIVNSFQNDPATYRNELLHLIPEIRQTLAEKVGTRVIHDYMKKTAIIVCISQNGWVDSIAMLVMQIRMVIDLSKALGYRPSWYFIINCLGWIFVNSILFAIFDGTEIIEEAIEELLPLALGNKLGNSIPIVGKMFGVALQGASSMAIIWATGKSLQQRLLGERQKLSGKQRIAYRKEGYIEAVKFLKPMSASIAGTAKNTLLGA